MYLITTLILAAVFRPATLAAARVASPFLPATVGLEPNESDGPRRTADSKDPAMPAEVERTLLLLGVRAKIGQLMMVGFEGTTAGSDARALIAEYGVGGIELLGGNVRNATQVTELTASLRELARNSGAPLPLLIGIDQEGGWITRVRDGATHLPGNMALGATGDPSLSFAAGQVTASELRQMGVNVNFAPVLDVNTNPANPIVGTRSFSDDPATVASHGSAYARGLQLGGVLAVGKHFPGHGAVSADSHLTLPVDRSLVGVVRNVHLPPFRTAVADGIGGVMTAHVAFPAFDPAGSRPATLSRKLVGDILRRELGFAGLVFTDDLTMHGALAGQSAADAALEAILAGADIILVGGPLDRQRAIFERLYAATQDGTLPMERLDESVRRVIAAKRRFADPGARPSERHDGAAVAAVVAERALTVLEAPRQAIRSGDRVVVVTPDVVRLVNGRTPLAEALERRGVRVQEVRTIASRDPGLERARAEAVAALASADAAIVATWGIGPAQARLAQTLVSARKPVSAVSLGSPYDLAKIEGVDGRLAAYGYSPAQQQAVAAYIVGELRPTGKLPVGISPTFRRGAGKLGD
ncbi:MAG: beta-N-acetylhexosaminidase [Chloroflexi bacterium]|nr:beta-N-acetylhexosaminidase [Chloroflexota bacterium]